MRTTLRVVARPAARKNPANRAVFLQQAILFGELPRATQRGFNALRHPLAILRMDACHEIGDRRAFRGAGRIDRIERGKARVAVHEPALDVPVPGPDPTARVERKLKTLLAFAQGAFDPKALCRLHRRNKHAADPGWRGLVWHRAVADGEIGVFERAAVALDAQQQVLGEHRLAFAGQKILVQRAELVLHFGPDFAEARPECLRMLLAEDRQVTVVVYDNELRPPAQRHRKLRSHDGVDEEAQACRPLLAGSKRGRGPIMSSDARGHLASAVTLTVAQTDLTSSVDKVLSKLGKS